MHRTKKLLLVQNKLAVWQLQDTPKRVKLYGFSQRKEQFDNKGIIVAFQAFSIGQSFRHSIRNFQQGVMCIERVIVPQIDDFHSLSSIRFLVGRCTNRMESGGERQRGCLRCRTLTSGQVVPK